jgi:hypothetical protein
VRWLAIKRTDVGSATPATRLSELNRVAAGGSPERLPILSSTGTVRYILPSGAVQFVSPLSAGMIYSLCKVIRAQKKKCPSPQFYPLKTIIAYSRSIRFTPRLEVKQTVLVASGSSSKASKSFETLCNAIRTMQS